MSNTVKELLYWIEQNPPKAEDYDYTMIAGGKFIATYQDSVRRNSGMSDDLVKALREAEGIPEGAYQFKLVDIMKIRK